VMMDVGVEVMMIAREERWSGGAGAASSWRYIRQYSGIVVAHMYTGT